MKNTLFTRKTTVCIEDLPVCPSRVTKEEADKVTGGSLFSYFYGPDATVKEEYDFLP